MDAQKPFRWKFTAEIEVSENWVADGFDLAEHLRIGWMAGNGSISPTATGSTLITGELCDCEVTTMAMTKAQERDMFMLKHENETLKTQLAIERRNHPASSVAVVQYHAEEELFYLPARAIVRFFFNEPAQRERAVDVDFGVRSQVGPEARLHIRGLGGQVKILPASSNYFNVEIEKY